MPACPSTRSMRAAFGSELASARRSYFIHRAAAMLATTATASTISAPCGQNLILFITPPLAMNQLGVFGESYSVRRNYEATRRLTNALLGNLHTIAEQSQQTE